MYGKCVASLANLKLGRRLVWQPGAITFIKNFRVTAHSVAVLQHLSTFINIYLHLSRSARGGATTCGIFWGGWKRNGGSRRGARGGATTCGIFWGGWKRNGGQGAQGGVRGVRGAGRRSVSLGWVVMVMMVVMEISFSYISTLIGASRAGQNIIDQPLLAPRARVKI